MNADERELQAIFHCFRSDFQNEWFENHFENILSTSHDYGSFLAHLHKANTQNSHIELHTSVSQLQLFALFTFAFGDILEYNWHVLYYLIEIGRAGPCFFVYGFLANSFAYSVNFGAVYSKVIKHVIHYGFHFGCFIYNFLSWRRSFTFWHLEFD